MAKQVRALERRSQAGAIERPSDDAVDADRTGETAQRCSYSKKKAPCPVGRADVAQILDQCFANVRRERQTGESLPLAADEDVTVLPVDVIKSQGDNLAGAKAEAGQQKQDRIIAFADGRPPVTICPLCLEYRRKERKAVTASCALRRLVACT